MNPLPPAAVAGIRPQDRFGAPATARDAQPASALSTLPSASTPYVEPDEASLLAELCEGIGLTCVFQPIVDFRTSEVAGYEGLVRGPAGTSIHSPMALFAAARRHGVSGPLELACRRTVLRGFVEQDLPERLFLNIGPVTRAHPGGGVSESLGLDETFAMLQSFRLAPERVVLELTEHAPSLDLASTRASLAAYRALGFEVALDDMGEGYASLRLWSELRPDYVKIDRHFVDGIDADTVKLQFVRSMRQIAETSGTRVIAEGIEHAEELQVVRDLGIFLGQGYFIARPEAQPQRAITANVQEVVNERRAYVHQQPSQLGAGNVTLERIASYVAPVSPDTRSEDVVARFESDPALEVLPVVERERAVGLIGRASLIGRFARPFTRELYGRKPCSAVMEPRPLTFDKAARVEDLSRMIAEGASRQIAAGFIVTDQGRYFGVAQGHALMRHITDMQLDAARYANPLTLLPGNVPIDDYMDRMIGERQSFHACYVDLDNFKPFNDVFGYRRGDDLIQLVARVLMAVRNPERDFLGHIGGDDFLILFRSPDWEARCREALTRFGEAVTEYFHPDQIAAGGFEAEDRRGMVIFHPITSLSIGVVAVTPESFPSHVEVSAAAADAKKMAKRALGNSLFIERRRAHR